MCASRLAEAACMLLLITLAIALLPVYFLVMILDGLKRTSEENPTTDTYYFVRREEEEDASEM